LFFFQIVLAGLALPLCGYIFGWLTGKLFCRSTPDATAIAIETGIQNTAIAIFLLASVDQPPIMPIAVATMTSFPLGFIYILIKIKRRYLSDHIISLIIVRYIFLK
jgi:predicted Na+-dependent transporter